MKPSTAMYIGIALVSLGLIWMLDELRWLPPGAPALIVGATAFGFYFVKKKIWLLIVSAVFLFLQGLGPLFAHYANLSGSGQLDALMAGLGFLFIYALSRPRIGDWALWTGSALTIVGIMRVFLPNVHWVAPCALIVAGVVIIVRYFAGRRHPDSI